MKIGVDHAADPHLVQKLLLDGAPRAVGQRRLFDRLRAEGIALSVPARIIRVSHQREPATHE